MSQSCVHLIAFALVAVLYICTVTSVSGSLTQNETGTSKNNSEGPEIGSQTENIPTVVNESTPGVTALPHTTLPPSTKNISEDHHINQTHKDHHSNHTHEESSGPQDPSIRTSAASNTEKSTTIISTPISVISSTTDKISTTMKSTAAGSQSDSSGGKGAGIFFLIIIIIIIVVLAVILYILWKKGKKYSFDLTNEEHDTPLRSVEPMGTFEQTKGSTANLDYIQEDNPNKTGPVANGCSGETPDQTPDGQIEQQNFPEEDSFPSDLSLNSPVKKVEFNLDLELIGGELELAKQPEDESTDNDNVNNNNETNTGNDSADLFTEINLDDAQ